MPVPYSNILKTLFISFSSPRQEIHEEGQKIESPDNMRRRSTFEIIMFKANSRY